MRVHGLVCITHKVSAYVKSLAPPFSLGRYLGIYLPRYWALLIFFSAVESSFMKEGGTRRQHKYSRRVEKVLSSTLEFWKREKERKRGWGWRLLTGLAESSISVIR